MNRRAATFLSSPSSRRWSSPLWFLPMLVLLVDAQGGFKPCSICPNASPKVGTPGLILPEGTVGITTEDTTCGELEADAQAGTYSPAVCAIIRLTVSSTCGCVVASAPTNAPVAVPPTTAPVVAPTTAPVAAPTGSPLAPPTTAPVAAPTMGVARPTTAPVAPPTTAPAVAPTTAPVAVAAPTTAPAAPSTAPVAPTTAPAAPTTAPVATTKAPTSAPAAVAPTAAPAAGNVTVPTAAPVAGNVTVPPAATNVTVAPAVGPTEAPAPAPPAPITGTIVVRMDVPQIVGNETAAFNEGCTAFLAEQLEDLNNVTCTYFSQTSSLTDKRDEVVARVTATPSADDGDDDAIDTPAALEEAAIAAVNDSPGGFVQDIQTASVTDFFANVTGSSVLAEAVGASSPTPAPATVLPSTSDDGLSTGGIVGIVIATVIGVVLIGMIAMRLNNKADEEPAPYAEVEEHVEEENIMVHPPPNPLEFPADAPRASVASRSAVQAAASGAGSVLSVSSMARDDGAESEVEGYSVKAGGSTTVDNAGSSVDVASVASGALSSLRHNMIARTVMIPPGKLGIVVDTTLEGPVVNRVNEASPVEGLLFPGDIIVAVDDVDTRAMSASAIYSLMKKTSDVRRVITVLSEDVAA